MLISYVDITYYFYIFLGILLLLEPEISLYFLFHSQTLIFRVLASCRLSVISCFCLIPGIFVKCFNLFIVTKLYNLG